MNLKKVIENCSNLISDIRKNMRKHRNHFRSEDVKIRLEKHFAIQ